MADLVPFEPLRDMMTLREAMNHLFEESFLRPGLLLGAAGESALPAMDIYETKDALVLKAVVPGLRPEDIEVTMTGDVLTIRGERREEMPAEGEQRRYLQREHRYGSFVRQLTLPAGIDSSKVSATFENGILTLEMPKVEEIRPKTIKISAKK